MPLIERKIHEYFGDQVNVMHSDDNAEKLVLRLRVNDIDDDEEETVCMYLKEFGDKLIHELALKGIHEVSKVTFTKYDDKDFITDTGAYKLTKDN
jgi:DNA-directed RNA polymerase II subunit RPB1